MPSCQAGMQFSPKFPTDLQFDSFHLSVELNSIQKKDKTSALCAAKIILRRSRKMVRAVGNQGMNCINA